MAILLCIEGRKLQSSRRNVTEIRALGTTFKPPGEGMYYNDKSTDQMETPHRNK